MTCKRKAESEHDTEDQGLTCQSRLMTGHAPSYHGYRFPPEIISPAVWLYTAKVGRNAPCPCGSGQKYTRIFTMNAGYSG